MATPTLYEKALANQPNLVKLCAEIDADSTISPKGVATGDQVWWASTGGGKLRVVMSDALTGAEETALDAVIAAHSSTPTLAEAKLIEGGKVDLETVRRITLGYEYPASSGDIFSLSDKAQTNLNSLKVNPGGLTYPYRIRTLDDVSTYDIANQADALALYDVAFAVVVGHLVDARAIKDAVDAATDQAGVTAAASAYLAGN